MGPLPGAPRGHSVVPAQRMPVQRTPTGQPGAGRRRCFCPRTRAPCPRSYRRACRRQAAPRASKIAGFMRGVPVSIRTHRTRGVSRWLHNMPCASCGLCCGAVHTRDRGGLPGGRAWVDSEVLLSQGTGGWQHGTSAPQHACNVVRMCGGRQNACGGWSAGPGSGRRGARVVNKCNRNTAMLFWKAKAWRGRLPVRTDV